MRGRRPPGKRWNPERRGPIDALRALCRHGDACLLRAGAALPLVRPRLRGGVRPWIGLRLPAGRVAVRPRGGGVVGRGAPQVAGGPPGLIRADAPAPRGERNCVVFTVYLPGQTRDDGARTWLPNRENPRCWSSTTRSRSAGCSA